MTILIQITAKSVYGETKYYPSNPAAEALARIAGTKTLTVQTLCDARKMGCEVALNGDKTIADLLGAETPSPLAAGWSPQTARQRIGGTMGS